MQHINHCRKTSLSYKLMQQELRKTHGELLTLKKLQKESPEASPLLWLRRTDHHISMRCKTNQKSQQKKLKKKNTKVIKIDDYFNCAQFGKSKPLQKMTNINLESALYLLTAAIKQCSKIYHMHGSSYFSIKNCYLNDENKLFFQTNTCSKLLSPYIAISDECVIVRDIIQSIHKICSPKCFDDFYSYYKRISVKNKCDFKYVLSLIKSYCMCSKIIVPEKVLLECTKQIYLTQGRLRQHPKSEERNLDFKLATIHLDRKKSNSRRQSIYKKLFQNIPQTTKIISLRQFQNKSQYKKFPSHQISIQPQYNLIVNPKNDQVMDKKYSEVKTSTVSTNFKSSHIPGDQLQTSNINFKTHNKQPFLRNQIVGRSNQIRENFTFLPKDLDEVQSLGQSSDYDQETQLPTRRFQTPKDHLQDSKKQNQQRILSINNWTRRIHGLLSQQTDVKQSFTQQTKQNRLYGSDPQNLKRMVRTLAQSILPRPSQFEIRQT